MIAERYKVNCIASFFFIATNLYVCKFLGNGRLKCSDNKVQVHNASYYSNRRNLHVGHRQDPALHSAKLFGIHHVPVVIILRVPYTLGSRRISRTSFPSTRSAGNFRRHRGKVQATQIIFEFNKPRKNP